jgi:hypothetical protein
MIDSFRLRNASDPRFACLVLIFDIPHVYFVLPVLVNDCLLVLSARSLGATLYTRNRDDFTLFQNIRSFSLVVIS